MSRMFVAVVVGLMSVVATLPEATAQQASSFEQLQVLVKPGDKIVVSDRAGKFSTGTLAELSASVLRLQVNGAVVDLPEADVLEIRQRRADSLSNGAKNGFLAGAGVGGTLFALACTYEGCSWNDAPGIGILIGFTSAIGVGIGVGIDALIARQQTIYRPNRNSSSMIRVTPVLGGGRKGIQFTVSF